MLRSKIDDRALAPQGEAEVAWRRAKMPVLRQFGERYRREKPFAGRSLLICMHCEPKAAVRTEVLLRGGAERIVFVGNLGSTKPGTAAYLAGLPGVTVLAGRGDRLEDLRQNLRAALAEGPYDLLMDNGAGILQQFAGEAPAWRPLGGIEETRSGRLILEREGIAPDFPLLVIDDSPVKRLIENEAGVGQSVVDGILRATSMLLGGKPVLVVGYGYCGAGITQRLRALGAQTMVWDTDPVRLLKARVEGHRTGALEELLPRAELVVTVTGRFDVLGPRHLPLLRDGAVLCNAGHYNMEIDVEGLRAAAREVRRLPGEIEEFRFADRSAYLLQSANPINLAAGAGNPLEVMDLGYALQLLSLEEILAGRARPGIQPLPPSVDREACRLCLKSWPQ